MELNVTNEEKRKFGPWLLIVLMIFVIAGFSFLWNQERNKRIKLENDKGAISTIEGIEQPGLAEVKQRESVNESIDQQIAEGNTRLNAMYIVEGNIRKRRDNYVSKKDDLNSIGRKLAAVGITNTVIFSNSSTTKTFRGYSSQAGRRQKTN